MAHAKAMKPSVLAGQAQGREDRECLGSAWKRNGFASPLVLGWGVAQVNMENQAAG